MSDNPWAFPVPNSANTNGEEGMTLRDYFAGQVLAGWMCDPSANPYEDAARNHIAEHCYRLADAMLRARQGGDS
jgi:hypothetical protein